MLVLKFLAIKGVEYGVTLFMLLLLIALKIIYPDDWIVLILLGMVFKTLVDWWFLPVKVLLVKTRSLEKSVRLTVSHLPRYFLGMIALGAIFIFPWIISEVTKLLLFLPVLLTNLLFIVFLGPLLGRVLALILENVITLPLDILITMPKYWFVSKLTEGKRVSESLKHALGLLLGFGKWWKEITWATFVYNLVPSLIRDVFLLLGWIFWPIAFVAGIVLDAWAEAYIISVSLEIEKHS